MLILTKDGYVYYIENDDYTEVFNTIGKFTIQPALVSLNGKKVKPEMILHDIDSHQIVLEPGYTFHSFIDMLGNYPLLLNLKVFAKSHYDRFNTLDLNYIDEPTIEATFGIVKATQQWNGAPYISDSIQLRGFGTQGVEFSDYNKYMKLSKSNKLSFDWIEEHGFILAGFTQWESLINCEIMLINHFEMGEQLKEPDIAFIEFMYAIFNNVCCCYVKEVEDRKNMMLDESDSDEDIEPGDVD